ncbi:hypothetical protein KR49_06425 [Synechococcus sp. KORDI-49]|nr:hypothetical protein KR49_06425 [Synechococcus sp. KORDI-49]
MIIFKPPLIYFVKHGFILINILIQELLIT